MSLKLVVITLAIIALFAVVANCTSQTKQCGICEQAIEDVRMYGSDDEVVQVGKSLHSLCVGQNGEHACNKSTIIETVTKVRNGKCQDTPLEVCTSVVHVCINYDSS